MSPGSPPRIPDRNTSGSMHGVVDMTMQWIIHGTVFGVDVEDQGVWRDVGGGVDRAVHTPVFRVVELARCEGGAS